MAKKRGRLKAWEERCKKPIPGKRNPWKRTPKGQKSRPKLFMGSVDTANLPVADQYKRAMASLMGGSDNLVCSCSTATHDRECESNPRFDCSLHGADMAEPCDCPEMLTTIRVRGGF